MKSAHHHIAERNHAQGGTRAGREPGHSDPPAVCVLDRAGIVIDTNQALARLPGFSEDLTGKKLALFLDPDSQRELAAMLENPRSPELREFDGKIINRQGRGQMVRFTLIPLLDDDREPVGLVARMEAENSAAPQTRRLRRLLEGTMNIVSEGLAIVGREGGIEFANPALAALFGFNRPREMTGLNLNQLVRSEILRALTNPDKERMSGDSLIALETEGRTRDGRLFPVAVTGLIMSDEPDRGPGLILRITGTGPGPESSRNHESPATCLPAASDSSNEDENGIHDRTG